MQQVGAGIAFGARSLSASLEKDQSVSVTVFNEWDEAHLHAEGRLLKV